MIVDDSLGAYFPTNNHKSIMNYHARGQSEKTINYGENFEHVQSE